MVGLMRESPSGKKDRSPARKPEAELRSKGGWMLLNSHEAPLVFFFFSQKQNKLKSLLFERHDEENVKKSQRLRENIAMHVADKGLNLEYITNSYDSMIREKMSNKKTDKRFAQVVYWPISTRKDAHILSH